MPRRYQRERRYICGQSRAAAQYQEVEIYPICEGAQASRELDRENGKPPQFRGTPKAQANHNAKVARRWFCRLLVTNFDGHDLHITLTYAPDKRPEDETQAWRDFKNFLCHLRTACKRQGLPPPECLAVLEWQEADPETGQKAVAPHFHVVLKCGLDRDTVERAWHRKGERLGRANADRLQFDGGSLEALANYLMKYPKRKHRYFRSRGIKNPVMPTPRDGKYTRSQVARIATDSGRLHDREYWARKYPGWELTEATATYNDFLGWSISLKMQRKRGQADGRGHKKPRGGGTSSG